VRAQLDDIRTDIQTEASGLLSGDRFLLEPSGDRFEVVASSGQLDGGAGHLSATGFAARWLRVNQVPLPVPDRIGIYDHLSAPDKEFLARTGTRLCVPLCTKRQLVAVLCLVGAPPSGSTGLRPPPSWAERLANGRAAAAAAERARTAERTNRLTVAGQVAAGIAHEVRNPLAAIRSSVQLLRDGDVSAPAAAQLLNGVLEEIDRVSAILGTVLAAGRASEGRRELLDLRTTAQQAVSFLRAYTRMAGVELKVVCSDQPVQGFVDPLEIRQILINLLLNACQASSRAAVVTVDVSMRFRHAEGFATFAVRDQGVGISASDLAKVFEPFFTTKVDGGGLGLAICREIAERNRWSVTLESTLGAGTTATLLIPVANGTSATR
jgi:signal transduction histidine kinase